MSEAGLADKLRDEGLDIDNCSTEEKILYVWKLYLSSEDELGAVLEKYDSAKSQHAAEVQEIEAYVEQIKSLSDERESLTLEFENENDLLKQQISLERQEVVDMLTQQGLDDVITSSVPEQVAFLLVERAKLLDALENELNKKLKPEPADQKGLIGNEESSSTQTQTSTPFSEGGTTSLNAAAAKLDTHESDEEEDLTTVTGDKGDNLSCHSNEELSSLRLNSESWEEECDGCRNLRKDNKTYSDKLIVAEEQLKSLERRINRYKTLLGEDVIHKDDDIAQLRDDVSSLNDTLKSRDSELEQRTLELTSNLEELSQAKTLLDSYNQRYEQYEQTCQPFDSTQTTLSNTHMSMSLTQPDDGLNATKQLESTVKELESTQSLLKSLQSELSQVRETSVEELEQTIMDYEQKLEALQTQSSSDSHDSGELDKLGKESSRLKAELVAVKETNSKLSVTITHLNTRISELESETLTYQNELEQVLANQEEELDRNEMLQQQLEKFQSEQSNDADMISQENTTLKTQYINLECQHTELLQKLASLTEDYESVMNKLSQQTEEQNSLSHEYEQHMKEASKISEDYTALLQIQEAMSDDVENYTTEIESLKRSMSQLQQQLEDENEFHKEELSHGDQKVSALNVELMARNKELSTMHEELENLKGKLFVKQQACEALEKQIKATNEELDTQQTEVESLNEKLCTAESELSEKTEELSSYISDAQRSEEALETLKTQILELEGDNFRLAESVRALTTSLEEKTVELDERSAMTAASFDSSENVTSPGDAEAENLVERMADLMSDHRLLTDEHQNLLTEYGDIDLRLSESQKEHDTLKNQSEALQSQNEALKTQNEALQSDHEAIGLKYSRLQSDYEELETESDNMSREISAVRDEIENVRAQRDEMGRNLRETDKLDGNRIHPESQQKHQGPDELSQKLNEVKAELTDTMEKHNIYKMEWESSLAERDNKNAELTERIILLEKAASELEGDNHDLAVKLREALAKSESIESDYKHEIQRLKSSNTRIQEQLERNKKYSDSIENEIESLQDKLKNQSQRLQDGSEKRESEIITLKTDLSQLKLTHSQQVDNLESRLKQANTEKRILQENITSNNEELSTLRTDTTELQSLLEDEKVKSKKLESKVTQYDLESSRLAERLKEVTERRAETDRENQRLVAEIKMANSKTESLIFTQDTDNNKALELAESRITSLEKQRDDLRNSLQQVTIELEHANQSIHEVSELRLELQAKKDEIIRLKSQIKDQQTQRSYEDNKIEDLRHNLNSSTQRENLSTEQNNQLRHKILDLESKLSKLQTEKSDLQHEVSGVEVKNKSVTLKISDLTAEKDTLELELMAANEKLQLHVQKYQERKNRHRTRIRTSRLLHETEIAKLRDRMEYQDRDVTLLKQSLEQEENLKLQSDNKCHELIQNQRLLLSKQVDLEDEIRERNRGIALLQTKLQYTEQENNQLTELCNKLKLSTTASSVSTTGGTDLMDTLLNQQQTLISTRQAMERSEGAFDMSMTLGRTTSMESLLLDYSKHTQAA